MNGSARLQVAIVALVLVLTSTVPAFAGNFGFLSKGWFCSDTDWSDPCNNVSLANNYTHTVYFAGVRSDLITATQVSMSYDYNPTQLDVWEDADSSADVIVMDNKYSRNGLVAWVVCPDGAQTGGSGNDTWCYGQHFRYNLDYPEYLDDGSERAHYACMELGHTVGLRHEGGSLESCMRNDTLAYVNLSSHDVNHINEKYYPY